MWPKIQIFNAFFNMDLLTIKLVIFKDNGLV